MVFYFDLCWGKLEDYEAQELDPPIVVSTRLHYYNEEHGVKVVTLFHRNSFAATLERFDL